MHRAQCIAQSSLGVIKWQSLLQLDMSSTTHYIYPLAILTIQSDTHIGTQWSPSPSLLFQSVSHCRFESISGITINICALQMITATTKVLLFEPSNVNYIMHLWLLSYAHSFQGWGPLLSAGVQMDTSVVSFTILLPSSLITPSKSCSPVSSKAGAPSEHGKIRYPEYSNLVCQMHSISR